MTNLLGVLVLVLIFSIIVITPLLVNELDRYLKRQRFIKAFNKAYSNASPSWERVQILAKRRYLDKTQMKKSFEKIVDDCLIKQGGSSEEKIKSVEEFISLIEKKEPFDGIPDRIVVHLENLKSKTRKNAEIELLPLANELRELSDKHRKKEREKNWVSVTSLVLGFIGAVFGGLSYIN